MKSAFLISVHKNPNQVINLARFLSQTGDCVFIHVDKRSDCVYESLVTTFNGVGNVYLLQNRIKTYWGGFNQVLATIELLKFASNHSSFDYFHFISGQDLPLKTPKEINHYLEKNNGFEFVENFLLPNDNWNGNGGLKRLHFFWCRGRNIFSKGINFFIQLFQKSTNLKRCLNGKFYGGSSWFTITKSCVVYILDYVDKNPNLKNIYRYTRSSDEIFFQTIIMNSEFKNKVVNTSLRYFNWKDGPPFPKVLLNSDFEKIFENKTNIFARKFDEKIDDDVIVKIYHFLNYKV